MNYKRIHDRIIKSAKKREMTLLKCEKMNMESHHIKPRSVTGDGKRQGCTVLLWPREHYIVHQLIVKFDIFFTQTGTPP